MKVIKPITFVDANLYSSSVAETEYATYNAATDYALGSRCIYNHVIYECVETPCIGKQPDIYPVNWGIYSATTNKWAMFDSEVSTQTSATDSISVVVKPGLANSLALFGLEGTTLTMTARDGVAGDIYYTAASTLDGTSLGDWYQYFFEPYVQLGECIFTDIPPYSNAHWTIYIDATGTVKCGALMAGTTYELGTVQAGANASIIDYSRKETSASGITTLNRRAFSKRMSVNMTLDTHQINRVQRTLAEVRAIPCAWIGTDEPGYEPLIIMGFYRDFSIDIAYATLSYCSLEIEGLA